MESPASVINTKRLKQCCQRTSRTVMSILDNGDVSMEILAKPHSCVQEGSQAVQEMVHISRDGIKVRVYQNNQGVSEQGIVWSCQEFVFPELPPKLMKKYMHAYRFVDLVKSRTPKIMLMTDRVKCKLMENSPAPDFQADFHDGVSVLLSKRKVHITDSEGNSKTSDVDSFSLGTPAHIYERFIYSKQCESECLRLEESFNNLNAKGESPELYPVTIGTMTNPVVIPSSQPTDSAIVSSPIHEEQVHSETGPIVINGMSSTFPHSFSCDSIQHATHISPQPSGQVSGTKTFDPHTSQETGRVNCCLSDVTPPSLHSTPQLEHITPDFGIMNNPDQPNLKYLETGANISMTSSSSVPQARHGCLQTEDGIESHIPSLPYCPDSFPQFCFSEFSTPVKSGDFNLTQVSPKPKQSLSEGYNKFKYCSATSQDVVSRELDNLSLQQECAKRKLFVDQQQNALEQTADEQGKYFPQQGFTSHRFNCTDQTSHQQSFHSKSPSESLLTSMHSVPVTQDDSIYSQEFDVSSSSFHKASIEATPNHVIKETLDTSQVSCFMPLQSSSIITTCSEPESILSPKKTFRKVASHSTCSLGTQLELINLDDSKLDTNFKTSPNHSDSEKYDTIAHLKSVAGTRTTNSGNISFNSSSSKMNKGLKPRPDHFNMSLPLLYDSRHHGALNSPQKQFLQSSDSGSERGTLDFSLPPQVRNSLDLSTSSNYSDSPSSSQSSSCEPLYQVFVPYIGWASYYASGAVWVLYNDGTQLGVKASEKTMTYIDQDGSQKKYNNKDTVPEIVKMKLEKFPSVLNAVLNCKR